MSASLYRIKQLESELVSRTDASLSFGASQTIVVTPNELRAIKPVLHVLSRELQRVESPNLHRGWIAYHCAECDDPGKPYDESRICIHVTTRKDIPQWDGRVRSTGLIYFDGSQS